MPPSTLFAVIFEGRTGSSELMARLNSHPDIQAFPEILHAGCGPYSDASGRQSAIAHCLARLARGEPIDDVPAAYSKLGAHADRLPVRGFKTRLNAREDLPWYERVERTQNFYQVDSDVLLPLLDSHGVRLIRLGRRSPVRHAISWLRALHLARCRSDQWNLKADAGDDLEPTAIDPDLLAHTIAWLRRSRARHDAAFASYPGPKLRLEYEDLFGNNPAAIWDGLLDFLGVAPRPLAPFHMKMTSEELTRSVKNYSEIEHLIRNHESEIIEAAANEGWDHHAGALDGLIVNRHITGGIREGLIPGGPTRTESRNWTAHAAPRHRGALMNQVMHPASDTDALRDPDPRSAIPAGDYVSANLEVVLPDSAFPHMVKGDLAISTWPYLRKKVPHNWYVDARNPSVGFVSRDEAAILYNTAKRFAGSPCLEIGCWRGWSTVHLALGAGTLDVVDPALSETPFLDDVRAACVRAGVGDAVSFHPGFSPEAVDSLAQRAAKRWSLIFIDGNHEGDAPYKDAEVVARHAADDAMVLFHDLVSPAVARGLDYFRSLGWRTRLYQTMQIMGVAWRGNVRPVDHLPDPAVTWSVPEHLRDYEIDAPGDAEIHRPDDQLRRERDSAWARATRAERDFASLSARIAGLQARLERAECLEEDFVDLTRRMVSVSRAAAEVVTLKGQLEAAQLKNDALSSRVRNAEHRVNKVHRQLQAEQSARVSQVDVLMKHIAAMAGRSEMVARNEAAAQARRAAAIDALSVWFTRTRVLLGLLRRPGSERIAIVRREAAARGMESLISPAMGHLLCRRRMLIGLLHHRRPSRRVLVTSIVRDADRDAAPEARAILAGAPQLPLVTFQASEAPSSSALSPTPLDDLMRDHRALQTRFLALENAKLDDEASLLEARMEIAALRVAIRRRTAENAAHG